jgi:hypothetical protein
MEALGVAQVVEHMPRAKFNLSITGGGGRKKKKRKERMVPF